MKRAQICPRGSLATGTLLALAIVVWLNTLPHGFMMSRECRAYGWPYNYVRIGGVMDKGEPPWRWNSEALLLDSTVALGIVAGAYAATCLLIRILNPRWAGVAP